MSTINSIADLTDELTAYRRELHQNPQTCYEETFASDLVAAKLDEWNIPYERGIAVTGIVATIEGQKTDSGKSIGLRADMDALDIVEQSGQPWSSKTPGKMHGCGHDGHTAMLLGAAKYLSETRNFNGTVYLIFQPAEEGGGGAIKMIEEGLFDRFPMDEIYGVHNWPLLPKGMIGTRVGPMMASTDELHIRIEGKGGHAALPHMTCDPAIVAAHIITALQSVVSRNIDPIDQAVVTVTNVTIGTGAFNVIADSAKMTGTIRAFKQETRAFLQKRVKDIVEKTAEAFGAKATCEYVRGYDPTINTEAETALCAEVCKSIVGDDNTLTDIDPCMGAEDFGAMLQEKPGCYIWVGQAESDQKSPHSQVCHSPFYDFNDDIIPTGVEFWAKLTEKALPLDK